MPLYLVIERKWKHSSSLPLQHLRLILNDMKFRIVSIAFVFQPEKTSIQNEAVSFWGNYRKTRPSIILYYTTDLIVQDVQ